MNSPRQLVNQAVERLTEIGIESAQVDAQLLFLHALGITRSEYVLLDDVTSDQAAAFEAAIAKRLQRIPLQHITGRAAFRHIEVNVGPGVLTPRPETELLVEAALEHPRMADELVVVDLCSGSAALTVSLALELAPASVTGLELETDAFQWGLKNLAEYQSEISKVGSTLNLIQGDVVGCEKRELVELVGKADIVVSNPPYIPTWAVPRDPEVHAHEPAAALYGGEDGMQFVDSVITAAAALLKPGGLIAIEHGDLQGEDGEVSVARNLRAHGGFRDVADHLDLAQRPRYTTGVRL